MENYSFQFVDLSFVVQGAIANDGLTSKVTKSIRKHFPGSKIVLSTWKGSDVNDIDYDLLVLSNDPGGTIVDDSRGITYNANRQIVSAREGLARVRTPLAVKTRTDCIFYSADLLSSFNQGHAKYGTAIDGELRILVLRDFFRNPRLRYKMPFHVSDFLFLSSTARLRKLFSAALMSESEIRWFSCSNVPKNAPCNTVLHRFSIEQYLWLQFLKEVGNDPKIAHGYEDSASVVATAEQTYANYLLVLSSVALRYWCPKHPLMYVASYDSYSGSEIDSILGGRQMPRWSTERILLNLIHAVGRLSKSAIRRARPVL